MAVRNPYPVAWIHFPAVCCHLLPISLCCFCCAVLARPRTADEYLHMAGRTGRCGANGKAISIVTFREADALQGWATQLGIELERDSRVLI